MAITFLTNEDKTKLEDLIKEMESKGFDGIYDIVSDMPINDDINMMSWWTKFELLTTPGVYKINLKKPDIDSSGNYISNRYIEEALILLVSYDYIPQEGDVSDEKHLTQTLISSTNIYKREGVDYIDAGSTGWGDWSQVLTNDILTITEKQNKTDDTLTTTDKTVVGAINEINSNKQIKDFTINCDVTIDDRDNMNILLVSATSTDITNALDENKNVVLNVATEFGAFVTNLIITNNYEFVFLYNDAQYTIVCGSNEGWYGYVTPLATDYDISNLETQIGDINTALETALNGGVS